MKFEEDKFDKIVKYVSIFGIVVAIFSIIFVLGTVLICEIGKEEKVVVTLVDKKVDRGLVRVGPAAVRVRKYIYVLDDEKEVYK